MPVQSLDAKDLEARREMADGARLAAAGKYRCKSCGRIDVQERGLIFAFAGNILLAVCPGCIKGPIIVNRHDSGSISIQMQRPSESKIVLASSMREVDDLKLATPKVEKVEL